jgi:hypothetical protein
MTLKGIYILLLTASSLCSLLPGFLEVSYFVPLPDPCHDDSTLP